MSWSMERGLGLRGWKDHHEGAGVVVVDQGAPWSIQVLMVVISEAVSDFFPGGIWRAVVR